MFKNLATQFAPDNDGVLVRSMIWLFGLNWKTSLSGFLSLLMGTFAVITSGIAPLIALYPQSTFAKVSAFATGVLAIFAGCAKFWVTLLMKDGGQQEVTIPGTLDTTVVPSHEIPDQPLPSGAKIVKP